jgi:hypothetical protein
MRTRDTWQRTLLSAVLLAAVASATEPTARPPGVDSLAWLSGCWMMKRPNGFTEEHWLKPAGGALLGLSRTIVDGRMKEYEFVAIREVDGRLAFVAKPSGQAEAAFPLKNLGAGAVVFENPSHDFPQRVIYRVTRRDASGNPVGLLGRIEGTLNGRERAMDFTYLACEVKTP